jgi:4-hydroxy-tetrahydrodipicolinate reductase
VAVVGLGEVGRAVARAALQHPQLQLAGAVDLAEGLAGKPLSALGVEGTALKVSRNLNEVAGRLKGGAVLLCTSSRVADVVPQVEAALKAGLAVVSTCEELAYPWLYHPEEGERLDRAAHKAGACVLGTGVNPGFVLDRLLATAGAACGSVQHAFAERIVDASTRRVALQRKVGAGLTPEAFDKLAEAEAIGHVGLPESCALAALGLGLDLDEVEEELSPVIAEEDAAGPVPVKAGQVAGIFQRARGFAEGREVVCLELTIAIGAGPSVDRIRLDADPPLELELKGGLPGDIATAWAVVNAVPSVVRAEPGLLTVLDLPAGR